MEKLKVLSLNCQKGHNENLKQFLENTLSSGQYDFLLLQEANDTVMSLCVIPESYNILSAVNQDIGQHSHIRIIYRDNFNLKKDSFVSFSNIDSHFTKRGELGFLVGTFEYDGILVDLVSVHLSPSFKMRLRLKELSVMKNHVLTYNKNNRPVIIGGDLNTGMPLENFFVTKKMQPEFHNATKDIGPTLNSQFTEKGTNAVGKWANFFKAIGITFKFQTDKIFLDGETFMKKTITACTLPDRVSDHSPVELLMG